MHGSRETFWSKEINQQHLGKKKVKNKQECIVFQKVGDSIAQRGGKTTSALYQPLSPLWTV